MNIDSEQISDYASWQHTVSEHQARIQQYLGLRPFDRLRVFVQIESQVQLLG
jgi:hypothetical protein